MNSKHIIPQPTHHSSFCFVFWQRTYSQYFFYWNMTYIFDHECDLDIICTTKCIYLYVCNCVYIYIYINNKKLFNNIVDLWSCMSRIYTPLLETKDKVTMLMEKTKCCKLLKLIMNYSKTNYYQREILIFLTNHLLCYYSLKCIPPSEATTLNKLILILHYCHHVLN